MDEAGFYNGPRFAAEGDAAVVLNRQKGEIFSRVEPFTASAAERSKYIEHIDFALIQQILLAEFKAGVHYGSRGEKIPPMPTKEDILFLNRQGFMELGAPLDTPMALMPRTNLTLVNVDLLEREITDNANFKPETIFLHILFHELNHSIASTGVKRAADSTILQTGIEQREALAEGVTVNYSFINEAINDVRARQMTARYLRSVLPVKDLPEADKVEDVYIRMGDGFSHVLGPFVLKVMARMIAEYTGVPSDDVWKSFWHMNLNGLLLFKPEVSEALDLDKVFGPGFTEVLKKFDIEEAMTLLIAYGDYNSDQRFISLVKESMDTHRAKAKSVD